MFQKYQRYPLKEIYSDVLFVQGLQQWCDDHYLWSLFPTCAFVHRSTWSTAYLCFSSSLDADYALQQHNCVIECPSHLLTSSLDAALHMHIRILNATAHKQKLYNLLMSIAGDTDQPSLYFIAMASNKLSVKEWLQIFPYAFDVYRIPHSHKAYIHFSSWQNAVKSMHMSNHQMFPLEFNQVLTFVYVSCEYVTEKQVLLYLNSQLKVLQQLEKPATPLKTIRQNKQHGKNSPKKIILDPKLLDEGVKEEQNEEDFSMNMNQYQEKILNCAKSFLRAQQEQRLCQSVIDFLQI